MAKKSIDTKDIKKMAPMATKQNNVFGRKNYIYTAVAAAIIALGFILMAGPADDTRHSTRRITVAPIVVMVGFAVGGYAIFYRDKEEG